jgi:hypothetical protein
MRLKNNAPRREHPASDASGYNADIVRPSSVTAAPAQKQRKKYRWLPAGSFEA